MQHCQNLKADRALGEHWEREFCRIAKRYGLSFTPLQIGRGNSAIAYGQDIDKVYRNFTLPDITIWTAPSEHHEVKHKEPTKFGTFGLEVYRFEALVWFRQETRQQVMYTIHDHGRGNGRNSVDHKPEEWLTVDIDLLQQFLPIPVNSPSYVNGEKRIVPIYYWNKELWGSLHNHFYESQKERIADLGERYEFNFKN